MKNFWACSLSGALVFLWGACAPARLRRPAWLVAEKDADFPAGRFLLAAAGAESPARAEELARRLVLEKAKTMLDAYRDDAAPDCARLFSRGERPAFLPEPETLRRWSRSDGKLHAALAGMELTRLKESLARERDGLRQESSRLLSLSTEKAEAGLALEGARPAASACEQLLRADVLERALSRLEDRPPRLSEPPALFERLRQLLASLEFRVIRGEGQARRPEGTLPGPVLLGAYLAGESGKTPAQGVPLRIEPPPPAPPTTCTTSELGWCSVELPALPEVPAEKAKVRVGLDIESFSARPAACFQEMCLGWLGLEKPALIFSYLAVPPTTRRIMLLIEPGSRMPPELAGQFIRRLEAVAVGKGFSLVDRSAAADELAMIESQDEVSEAVHGVCDAVLLGTLSVFITGRPSPTLHFCRAEARLRLVNTADGAPVFLLEEGRNAAGREETSACRRAVDSLAARCAAGLDEALGKSGASP